MPGTDIHALLAEAGWLMALARRLARDPAEAADAVQDTWAAALDSPPDTDRPLRPWLRRVLENALRMRRRASARRAANELSSAALAGDHAPTPEQALARAQLERRLAELVLALDEPYRSTVLLRYQEGLSAERIAAQAGIPAGTVRWRLKTALDRLRAQMDEAPPAAEGRSWRALVLPAAPATATATTWLRRAIMAKSSTKLLAVLAALLLLLGGAALVLRGRGGAETRAADDPTASPRGDGGPADRARAGKDDPGEALRLGAAMLPRFVQPGLPSRRIAGRVSFAGAPVAGASVRLLSLETKLPVAEVTTGADGGFELGERPAAAYAVVAAAADRSPARRVVDLRSPQPRPAPDALELELGDCDHRVTGVVSDGSGGVIAGARVAAGESRWPVALTDTAGRYRLCVGWGQSVLTAGADGYNRVEVDIDVDGPIRRDVALIPEAIVSGRVVRAEDDSPLAGALVVAASNDRGTERGGRVSVVSGGDGGFRLHGVTAGRNLITVVADDAVTTNPIEVVAEVGRELDGVVLRVPSAATLRGRVVERGRPVAGAAVAVVVGHRFERFQAVTQADGSFVIERAPATELALHIPGWEVESPVELVLRAGETREIEVSVRAIGAVSGRVLLGGEPVRGALVDCDPDSVTGADGRYSCRGTRVGEQLIFASTADGRWGQALVGGTPPVLARGERVEADIELAYGASICGTVVDQAGKPVAGAYVSVQLDRAYDFGKDQSGEDGGFCARFLSGGGAYRVEVRAGSLQGQLYRPVTPFPLVPVPEADTRVDGVVLAVHDERQTISGRVVDGHGAPVADARVLADAMDSAGGPSFRHFRVVAMAVTDADGRFSIADLPGGDYALMARGRDGGESTLSPVRAGAGDVRLVLEPAGRLEGRLVGFTTPPNVVAIVRDYAHDPLDAQVVGDRFRISAMPPGDYVLTAGTGGEMAIVEVTVRAGETATATLTSRGAARVRGRLIDLHTGKPLHGRHCDAVPRTGDVVGVHYDGPDAGATTDEDGRFTLERATAGEILVFCNGPHMGGAELPVTVARGDTVEVHLRSVSDDSGRVPLGAQLEHISLAVKEITAGGPADRAGLRVGDVVVAVDGEPVTGLSPRSIVVLIMARPAGKRATVTIARAGESLTLEVQVPSQ